jgi:ATP-dependent DNA ligase
MTDANDPIPADPREWRPQRRWRGRGTLAVDGPIVEPAWSGRRVIVLYRDADKPDEWGHVEAFDEEGADPTADAPRAFDQLRRAVLAREAVLDGIVTDQATDPDTDRIRIRAGDRAFVALDLLRLDGQMLFDVPLLERKRLLDSVVEQSALVRVTPWVRPPYRAFMIEWQAAGFRGVMLKAANSRYTPGIASDEWSLLERLPMP